MKKYKTSFNADNYLALSRRRFVQGLVAGGVLAATPGALRARQSLDTTRLGNAPVLSGRVIDLVIEEKPVNFTGVTRMATTINGSIPAPTLKLREGDEVVIRVTNHLAVDTSIHWHGIILPYQMDGVPGISFPGIKPGETFVYQFKLQQSGTYWYHSHSGFQEMTGMYGALIVEPRDGEIDYADRDYVIQLSDWTDEDPMRVFEKVKAQSDTYNFGQPTLFDFTNDISTMGINKAMEKREMWNKMRMNPTDLSDLSAATLTFLMNGVTPAGNWTGVFNKGEQVRLRFINGASNTFYDVRIPGLKMKVIQADGQNVEPVTIDEFRFGPGETYDVIVKPDNDAHTIFAQTMDRTGYARGTLAVSKGLSAPVPSPDPVEWLTMADMMGTMGSMGSMSQMGMNDPKASKSVGEMSKMSSHHGGMVMEHAAHTGLSKPSQKVRHASTEYGPSVDQRVNTPSVMLNDPGIGLRNNGRKVLTYADLRSRKGVMDDFREAEKEVELHLTGNMERYTWSFDGLEFGKSTPVHLPHKKRIRVILQNDTMMTHPMHLHGMWSDLETANGELMARRHTISVQPAQRISFLTTPHDLGRWAWHCHLLFHMDAGMFRQVIVN